VCVSAVHDPAGIDEVFAAMAQGSSGGVLVMPNNFMLAHPERIVTQAERYRVPTIYPDARFATAGGLLSYGVDAVDLFRRAASYTDRILKGAAPADLPVQEPTKFELVINTMAAASSLGIEIIPSPVDSVADIEQSISSLARQDNIGLLCPPEAFITAHRDLVIALAAKYRLPAVYVESLTRVPRWNDALRSGW
jgi:ABC-type uncharacterized transport system substrate-binding protein